MNDEIYIGTAGRCQGCINIQQALANGSPVPIVDIDRDPQARARFDALKLKGKPAAVISGITYVGDYPILQALGAKYGRR